MNLNQIVISETYFSLEEQVELGRKASNGDTKAREKLILACVPIVKSFVNTVLCHRYSTFDDALQDGMLGVLMAVDKYDYRKNVKFTTYAFKYIHKMIYKGIIERVPLKITKTDFFNALLIASTIKSFQVTYMVPPTCEQLSQLTGIPIEDIELYLKRDINNMVTSLDENYIALKAQSLITSDDYSAAEAPLKQFEQRKIIEEALNTLSDDEKEIIVKRYLSGDNKTSLKELAARQNIYIATASKREQSALKKLFAFFVERHISFDDLV